MFKNTTSQKLTVYAFDSTTNLPKTGDGANLTAYVSKDDGTLTVLADTSATEVDATNGKGYYIFDLAQGETNGDKLLFSCKSSTSNIVVLGMPAVVYTTPPNFTSQSIDSNGRVDVIKIAGTTQTARDIGTSVLLTAAESKVLQSGTASAGAASTITIQTALGADSLPVGCLIKITSGTGVGQARIITAYVNSTKVTTVDRAWVTNPDNTSVYSIEFNELAKLDANLKVAGVVLADTVTTYTGNTVQTGDAFARVGAAGAGLTALGDTRIANLDAATSSRMATFTLPTNFSSLVIDSTGRVNAFLIGVLTSVFTEGATGRIAAAFKQFFNIASPAATMDHGILVDTVTTATTATNLTNAPTSGDLTATMKTSVTTAASSSTPSVTVSDKTGFSLSTAGVLAIWHQLSSAVVTAATMGKLVVDYLNASVSAIKTKTDYLPSATAGTNGGLPTADGNNAVKVQSGTGANQIDLTNGKVKTVGGLHR